MALELDIRLEGERQIAKILSDLPAKANDLKKPFTAGGDFILRETKRVFSSKGSSIDEPWPARSPAYEAKATWPILDKTSKMKTSFKRTATKTSLRVENPTKYFKYHQSRRPRSRLPRRPMLKLTPPIARFIAVAIQREYEDYLKARVRDR